MGPDGLEYSYPQYVEDYNVGKYTLRLRKQRYNEREPRDKDGMVDLLKMWEDSKARRLAGITVICTE